MVDRVYESNAIQTPPAAPADPSEGYPTAGNPAQGIPATRPGAHWYYMVTEALRALVSGSGQVPDHTDLGQVLEAVNRLSARGVTTVANADSPKALGVAEAGLVLVDATDGDVTLNLPASAGNGGLSYTVARIDSSANVVTIEPDGTDTIETESNRVLSASRRIDLVADSAGDWKSSMLVALDAEAQAFQAGRVIDGAALAAAFAGGNSLLSENGLQRLPGGLILQWISVTPAVAGSTYALPMTFPNAVLSAGGVVFSGSSWGFLSVVDQGLSQVKVMVKNSSDAGVSYPVKALVIGY